MSEQAPGTSKQQASPEEILKWREANKDKLSPKNTFRKMPDGTVAHVGEKELTNEEIADAAKERLKDMN